MELPSDQSVQFLLRNSSLGAHSNNVGDSGWVWGHNTFHPAVHWVCCGFWFSLSGWFHVGSGRFPCYNQLLFCFFVFWLTDVSMLIYLNWFMAQTQKQKVFLYVRAYPSSVLDRGFVCSGAQLNWTQFAWIVEQFEISQNSIFVSTMVKSLKSKIQTKMTIFNSNNSPNWIFWAWKKIKFFCNSNFPDY